MFRKKTGDKHNGIEFTRRNRITLTNKILISPLLKVLQYVLITSGVYGTIFCFISGLDIEVNVTALFTVILISVLYFFVMFTLPGFKYCLHLTFLIYLLAGYVFRDEIKNGFWHIENIYIGKFNVYYNSGVLKYLVEDYEAKTVITVFFIFVSILLSQMLCGVILKNTFRALFIIVTLPIVILSFTVGYIPSPLPFGFYLACVIGVIGMGTTLKEKHRHFNLKSFHEKQKAENRLLEQNFKYIIGLKIGGLSAFVMLSLILILSAVFTPEFYAKYVDIADTKQKIQKKMMEFSLEDAINDISSFKIESFELFKGITATGGLSGGKLGRIGEVNFNYETALRIKAPIIGTSMYLKGYVGSEYMGDHWEGLNKTDLEAYDKVAELWEHSNFTIGNQSSYFLSLIQGLDEAVYPDFAFCSGEIEVECLHSNRDYVYAPYYSEFAADGAMEATDPEYVTSKKRQKSYKLDYYSNYNVLLQFDEETEFENCLNYYNTITVIGDEVSGTVNSWSLLTELNEYRAYEQAYREFVYDTYTRVPENSLERIKNDFGTIHYDDIKKQVGSNALNVIIQSIKSFLQNNTVYSLTPGILPKGKDFSEYFLYENKTGYCSHYASAATMIFRTIGIPARYVEGYVVKQTDINQGDNAGLKTVKERINGTVKEYQVTVKTIDIPDANAHAWVEVYLDGFGWIPVDVTPGYSGNVDASGLSETLLNQVNPLINTTPSVSSSQSPKMGAKEEGTKKQEEFDEKAEVPAAGDKETSGKDAAKSDNQNINFRSYIKKIGWIILGSIILMLGVALIILLRALFIMEKRKNAQKTRDFSKRALLRYNEIRRMLDYYQISVNEELTYQEAAVQIEKDWKIIQPGRFKQFMDIVLKARFNQNLISKAEAEEAEKFYQELIDSIYKNISLRRKIILKYIKVFH